MTATRVVNLRAEPYDVYIGRAGHGQSGYFGNPYRIANPGLPARTLAGILDAYRKYFEARLANEPEFRARVLELRGKTLGCFCKPGPCHGDVIVEWLESQP